MKLPDKIERLIESRQTEAIQKKISEKLRLIASVLGFPICDRSNAGGLEAGGDTVGHSHYELLDPWYEEELEEGTLPTDPYLDESRVLGYCFDGLSSGIHLQIYLEDEANFLKASFQGIDVFQERQGKLEKYIPSMEWERWMETLFLRAEARGKIESKKKQEELKKKNKKTTEVIVDYLRKNWGF